MSIFAQAFGNEELDPLAVGDIAEPEVQAEALQEDAEVVALEKACEELEAAIETSEQAADALEAVQEFVEAKQEEGGMTEGEAAVTAIAAEGILNTAFKGYVSIKMPANESFGGQGGKATATTFALEAIGQKIADIWAAIKKFIKDWYAKAVEWFRGIFTQTGRLEKAAKAMVAKAEATKGSPKEPKLDLSGGEYKAIAGATDGSVITVDDLRTIASVVGSDTDIKSLKQATKQYADAIRKLEGDSSSAAVDAALDSAPTAAVFNKASFFGNDLAQSSDARFAKVGDFGYLVSAPIVGRKVAVMRISGKKTSLNGKEYSYVDGASISLDDATANQKWNDEYSVDALDRTGIINMAGAVAKIANDVRVHEKQIKSTQSENDKVMASLDKVSSRLDKEMLKKDKQNVEIQAVVTLVRSAQKLLPAAMKMSMLEASTAMTVAKGALSYCGKSLRNLSESND